MRPWCFPTTVKLICPWTSFAGAHNNPLDIRQPARVYPWVCSCRCARRLLGEPRRLESETVTVPKRLMTKVWDDAAATDEHWRDAGFLIRAASSQSSSVRCSHPHDAGCTVPDFYVTFSPSLAAFPLNCDPRTFLVSNVSAYFTARRPIEARRKRSCRNKIGHSVWVVKRYRCKLRLSKGPVSKVHFLLEMK